MNNKYFIKTNSFLKKKFREKRFMNYGTRNFKSMKKKKTREKMLKRVWHFIKNN